MSSKRKSTSKLDKTEREIVRPKRAEKTSYREASSDDEFAKEHFMYSSDDDSLTSAVGKKRPREGKRRSGKADSMDDNNDLPSDEEDNGDDKIDYRIEHILSRRSLIARDWIPITDKMVTREITKGSVLQQPDDEYYDPSDVPVEKFLIKWAHASYLHISWETEKDLIDLVGNGVKNTIKKYLQRELEGRELFEDLAQGEYFPASYIQIERILDVDDKDINVSTIKWESVKVPDITTENSLVECKEVGADAVEGDALIAEEDVANKEDSGSESDPFAELNDDDDEEEEFQPTRPTRRAAAKRISYFEDSDDEATSADKKVIEHDGEAMDLVRSDDEGNNDSEDLEGIDEKPNGRKIKNKKEQKSINGKASGKEKQPKKKSSQKKNQFLHGDNCWVTVKWEGLAYSDVTFESLNDIIRSKVDYEAQLRTFYKREQAPAKESQLAGARKLNLDHTIIGPTAEQPPFPGGELRDYQWEGVRWMLFNLMQGRNSILADEMGLGKTIQSSALLHMLKKHQKTAGPFLVVAPLSTIVNWQREVRTWTNLDAIMYYGSQDDRELIRSYEFNFLDKKKKGYKVEVVITTPETCIATDEKTNGRMKRVLSRIAWDLIIVDEAHKLKNYESKLSSTLREEYSYRNCVLLTGTPLQNNTDELWTLLNFVGPSDFADHEDFMTKFGDLKCTTQLEDLHRRIKPYLLRREKENVEKTVPPKEEIVIEVELTVPQKQYYRAIFEQKTGFLYRANMKDGPSLTNLAMELRKCCNHPYLIKGAPTEIAKHFKDDSHQDVLIKSSGKMTLLDKLLPKLKADGHRVLIFSQFRMMLDIIEDCIHHAGYTYERVDGSIVGSKRQAAIDRFTNNDNIFVMLLSTKAGGVGINLTAADTVIIYDSDWNPQNDIQAQARAHRIGQTRSVTVYRLLTRKTYEMAMFRAASIKLGLDYAVMHNMNQSVTLMPAAPAKGRGGRNSQQQQQQLAGISNERADTVSALSRKELENLLKHGAYDIFMEEKDGKSENESKSFVEESIEQILERSSIFMHQENDSKVQCMKSTSSFAKASFVSAAGSETEAEEVAIDDPDFWSKVVGLSVEDQAIALGAKRKCRQNVESYKEPGMSIKSIYGDRKSAYMTDSDDDSDDGRGTKRRRKANEEPELVPAEFTYDNLQSILSAMTNHGYGSWPILRRATKLWWSDADISKACTFNVLSCLMWASMAPVSDGKSNSKVSSNKEASTDDNVPAIMEATINESAMDEDAPVTSATAASSATPATLKFDSNVFISLLRRYKGCKLALVSFALHYNAQQEGLATSVKEDDLFVQLVSKMDHLSFDLPLPSLAIRKSLQSAMISVIKQCNEDLISESSNEDEILNELATMVISAFPLNAIGHEVYNLNAENDASKIQKRVSASKSKLAQIEDLFEARFYVEYSKKRAQEENPGAAMISEVKDAAKMDVDETANDESAEKNIPSANVFRLLSDTADEESAESGWTLDHDHSLMFAVQEYGAPDGKRRYVKIMEYLAEKHSNIDYTGPNSAVFNAVEANNITEEDGQRNNNAEISEPITPITPTTPSNSGIHEKFTPKFLVGRVKALSRMLRCTDEELASLAKQEAAAAAALAKQQAAETKARAAEKQLRKKQVQQVFKTIGRIGYPRSAYKVLAENVQSTLGADSVEWKQRSAYLLTWGSFLQECDIASTLDIDTVQEIVNRAIDILNDPEQIGGTDGTCTTGILEEVSYKIIDGAFEKVDTLHHIRILLALHSENDLKQLIKTSCKVAGPDVPTFRRDMTMPVWWTLQHDLELMKLCLIMGLNQWKKLIAEPLMSTAPADFEMPPKTHGTEWVLALTTKNAEKRIQSLLRGLPAMRTLSLPAPTSPQRKSALRAASSSGVNTLAAAFSNITNANNAGSGNAASWFSKATSTMNSTTTTKADPTPITTAAVATAAVSIVDDNENSENVPAVAVVTAQPTTIMVVVDEEPATSAANATTSVVELEEVVIVNTPAKIAVSSSNELTPPQLVAAAVAQQAMIVDDEVVGIVLDDVTPSRADETSASKKLSNAAMYEDSKDAASQKIDLLVEASGNSASSQQAITVDENKAAAGASKPTPSAKKNASKKAEKSASEAVGTKSILSFFKRA